MIKRRDRGMNGECSERWVGWGQSRQANSVLGGRWLGIIVCKWESRSPVDWNRYMEIVPAELNSPMAEIARYDTESIILVQVGRQKPSKMCLLICTDCSNKNWYDNNIQTILVLVSVKEILFGGLYYPWKTFRTYGRCISILCSSSSVLISIVLKEPVAFKSLMANRICYSVWNAMTVDDRGLLSKSNGRFPSGVKYSLHPESAHPSR